jgi:hypothetical protein
MERRLNRTPFFVVKCMGIQKFKDSRIQKFKDSKIQGFKNSKNSRIQFFFLYLHPDKQTVHGKATFDTFRLGDEALAS